MAAMATIFLLTLLQGGLAQARGQNLVEEWFVNLPGPKSKNFGGEFFS